MWSGIGLNSNFLMKVEDIETLFIFFFPSESDPDGETFFLMAWKERKPLNPKPLNLVLIFMCV